MPQDTLILEGLVTTECQNGTPNASPMGPRVSRTKWDTFNLRPFQSSRTLANLRHRPCGVLHVVDDVLVIARAAIGKLDASDAVRMEHGGWVLPAACRWYAFDVVDLADEEPRATITCRVTQSASPREFFGFNRAKHAVVEAAILATRVGILPAERILAELEQLVPLVSKTAGEQERDAFALLRECIEDRLRRQESIS